MGADCPRIKSVFLRAHRAITWVGQIGGMGPIRGTSPNCPKPQISRFFAFLTNFRRNDFRFFLRHQSTNSGLSTVEIWWNSDDQFPRNGRQSAKKTSKMPIFKPPYLPQMGADSHGTKSVFLRSPRAITCTGQIGALVPLSGFSPKVTLHHFGEP